MKVQKRLDAQLEIKVKVMFVPEQSKPEEHFFYFAYQVTVKNKGSVPAQLISRHWVITDGHGQIEEVRGPGVVGLQPRIQPGESFDYESACPLTTSSGSMKGSYQMTTDDGNSFSLEIPEFFLVAPQALH